MTRVQTAVFLAASAAALVIGDVAYAQGVFGGGLAEVPTAVQSGVGVFVRCVQALGAAAAGKSAIFIWQGRHTLQDEAVPLGAGGVCAFVLPAAMGMSIIPGSPI